jgi:hypothetical protein
MVPIRKYPRTPHLTGSRLQPGDEDLATVARETLRGLHVVVEEKLDGSNSGISFSADGELILQSRGHVLTGGARERQFALLKRWAGAQVEALRALLGDRYVMYGEWLYARHTIPYDRLPHYFLEFDVYDRERDEFLSTARRRQMLAGSPVVSAPVLGEGELGALETYLGPSLYSTTHAMEGLYLKHEEDGRVVARYKYVQPGFLQAVSESGEHWMERPLEPNQLRNGFASMGI